MKILAHQPHGHDGHAHHRAGGSGRGRWSRVVARLRPHRHDPVAAVDGALRGSSRGLRALAVSFGLLVVTALLQLGVVALTGSVALLSDAIHNFSDAFSALPLAIAFTLGRRAATRRLPHGYGRAEDLAGLVVVALIAASALLAGYEAVSRLLAPAPVRSPGLVALAALIGAGGNELVARYRIRVGRQVGSAALVADGLHARSDALTSLAVLLGAAGVALGVPAADPAVGLLIVVAILFVLRDAAREVIGRLMDAVDPAAAERVEALATAITGVQSVHAVRLRWAGHTLSASLAVVVDAQLSVADGHHIAERVRHELLHHVEHLATVTVHVDPSAPGADPHAPLSHHTDPLLLA